LACALGALSIESAQSRGENEWIWEDLTDSGTLPPVFNNATHEKCRSRGWRGVGLEWTAVDPVKLRGFLRRTGPKPRKTCFGTHLALQLKSVKIYRFWVFFNFEGGGSSRRERCLLVQVPLEG